MNAAIRAVVRTANYYHLECFGIREGYSGLMEGNLTKMGARSVKISSTGWHYFKICPFSGI